MTNGSHYSRVVSVGPSHRTCQTHHPLPLPIIASSHGIADQVCGGIVVTLKHPLSFGIYAHRAWEGFSRVRSLHPVGRRNQRVLLRKLRLGDRVSDGSVVVRCTEQARFCRGEFVPYCL